MNDIQNERPVLIDEGKDRSMKRQIFCAIVGALFALNGAASTAAEPPERAVGGRLVIRDDGVRVTVVSSSAPSWQAVIDRRKGGVITELRIPATAENLVSADGGRFEGLCNLVYVDFDNTAAEAGKQEAYVAKGTYSYHGALDSLKIAAQSAERLVVIVSGKAGNQSRPRGDVVAYQQEYEFLPDRIVCTGALEWLFDQVIAGSHPELIQLNCKFAPNVVTGDMRVWGRNTGPLPLPETNSKGLNFPEGIEYPVTVEVPLQGGSAVRIRSLDLPPDFAAARFYWNEFPRQIEGARGFAFKAWEGWPGNGAVKFRNDEPIRYRYEMEMTNPLPPPSSVVSKLTWAPATSIVRRAPGSDNWPATWGDDGNLYAAYGDGNGFTPFVESKLSLGLARITGAPDDFQGVNLRSPGIEQTGPGAAGKKASGLLMVDGVLSLWVRNAGNSQLAQSGDHGKTWTWAGWKWTTSFGCPTFLNFGANYADARDDYVYVYSPDSESAYDGADRMVLARAPKTRLAERDAYEFFVERTATGDARWSRDFSERGSVFSHPGKCCRSGVTFNSGLKRYLWCQIHPQSRDPRGPRFQGGFGVYDAPTPWGPWTTIYYTDDWDVGPGDTSSFPTKWMSADGRTLHLVFSGDDSFSVRQARLETK
jgi:hypothetical protein